MEIRSNERFIFLFLIKEVNVIWTHFRLCVQSALECVPFTLSKNILDLKRCCKWKLNSCSHYSLLVHSMARIIKCINGQIIFAHLPSPSLLILLFCTFMWPLFLRFWKLNLNTQHCSITSKNWLLSISVQSYNQ